MGRAAVIFDLDDTLVDTQELTGFRNRREWKAAVKALDRTELFPGIQELVGALATRGIPWAVVTTSVSFYAAAVLRHHGLGSPPLVAYHDSSPKPHPSCIIKATQHLKLDPAQIVGLGDHMNDHAAYSAAGVLSIGAGWSPVLQNAAWDSVISTPMELLEYL
ncbi:HAD family hydrolase [Longimicrobium terrae]|uniref:Phosphoglycolate phosphatase n=1 Tax=Longimicrobium terrae TaxID=1639882 RepID=A0A841GN05_9BACT|nr:HAD hydrolase-like protein [Longimicrobium terrae]MBB4635623.1 phosphoglycolate phosphatase [Longimicrobium terrae]MBB6070017.1 phosphoglycolate phosphatase [Longimicrobium terrae]NNC32927.1 HAD family hydrolase [Longimicrobium terrae]